MRIVKKMIGALLLLAPFVPMFAVAVIEGCIREAVMAFVLVTVVVLFITYVSWVFRTYVF